MAASKDMLLCLDQVLLAHGVRAPFIVVIGTTHGTVQGMGLALSLMPRKQLLQLKNANIGLFSSVEEMQSRAQQPVSKKRQELDDRILKELPSAGLQLAIACELLEPQRFPFVIMQDTVQLPPGERPVMMAGTYKVEALDGPGPEAHLRIMHTVREMVNQRAAAALNEGNGESKSCCSTQ